MSLGATTQLFDWTHGWDCAAQRNSSPAHARGFKARRGEKCWKSSLCSGNFAHSKISRYIFVLCFRPSYGWMAVPKIKRQILCRIRQAISDTFFACAFECYNAMTFSNWLETVWGLSTAFYGNRYPFFVDWTRLEKFRRSFQHRCGIRSLLPSIFGFDWSRETRTLHTCTHVTMRDTLLWTFHDYWYWCSVSKFCPLCQLNHSIYLTALSFVGRGGREGAE